jgi:AcrR family transcriptional regulator
MQQPARGRQRTLTRQAIVERALELGEAEGLEAVSLRRLATELGVTPMALYRHVKDKQDLVNAMYEAIVENFDLRADVRPGMKWTTQLRRALMNIIALHDRPVALPLAIAYSGGGSPAIWRMYESGLEILMRAGFSRREAVELNRMLSTLVAGYVLIFRQAPPLESDEMLLARKRFELELLSLPRAEYPTVVASARELTDAQFSNPQQQLKGIVDFMVGGVEAMLEKRKRNVPGHHRRESISASD